MEKILLSLPRLLPCPALILPALFLPLLSTPLQAAVSVASLKCEYAANPLDIGTSSPRLSWIIKSDRRGEKQTAYQVLVASSPNLLSKNRGDLWDSGRVISSQSAYNPYRGAPLASRMRCFWKVRVWDKDARVSAWSQDAAWTMGLLNPGDWTARWITASKWFTPPEFRPPGWDVGPRGGWADVDLGASLPINAIILYPLSPSNFPTRFKLEGSDDLLFENSKTLADYSSRDYALNGTGAQNFPIAGAAARFVRLSIPASGRGSAVRQMEVISGGKNAALMKFTRQYAPGTEWGHGLATFLVDGMPSHNQGGACPPDACPAPSAPLLRKSFILDKEIRRATLYVAALGWADFTLNGKKVGDQALGPPFSDCFKRVYYVTHDITPLLTRGENVLGATLGNGFFSTPGRGFGHRHNGDGPPRILAQAEIEFADGSRQIIGSDATWKWACGEITFNDVWLGYREDRRLARSGWDQPQYNDADWQAVALAIPPEGKLCASMAPPIRVLGELKPSKIEGNHAFFQVLSSGWPRVKVNGKAGQTITIADNLSFTLAKDGPAVLEPRFVILSGPTDLQIDGLTEPLAPDAVSILQTGADLSPAGSFACSNPFLNNLYEVTLRTHHNYIYDFPLDPTREKEGWTQDAEGIFDMSACLADVRGLYRRWWRDMADNQDDQGYLGSVVPIVNRQMYEWNSPWWSGVLVFLPWEHYKFYGDPRILEEAYEPMRRYVDFLGKMAAAGYVNENDWEDYPYLNKGTNATVAKEGMLIWNGAGDWQNPDFPSAQAAHAVPTPITTMPAWYYYSTIVSQTAALLGNVDDCAKYAAVAQDVKNRFNARYFHPDTGLYGDKADSQTSLVLPLAVGMVPEDKQQLTYRRFIEAIHAKNDHLGTGFVALPWLLQTLAAHRESALANKIVNQTNYPSWATLIQSGVLTEAWDGSGVQMPACGGAIGAWLFQSVLGIQPDPAGPGFKKFILAPQPDPATGLTSAHGFYDTIHGRIASDWKRGAGKFTLRASIPANSTATLFIPASAPESVTESGRPVSGSPGVKFLRSEPGAVVYELDSGRYDFTAAMP